MNFAIVRGCVRAALSSVRSIFLFVVVSLQIPILNAHAGQQALAWDSVSDSRLVGYMVSYGTASGSYSSKIDVGKTTSYVVPIWPTAKPISTQ